jgi:Zn-dependent M16 (insulinase) family peptidase
MAELVLTHQLSTGPLWEDIRMKGGAYGAFAHTDSMERIFAMSTFRDPNPLRSIDSFRAALAGSPGSRLDGEALDHAIVGTYAREVHPRGPSERGASDFFRFLYGLNDEQRLRNIKWLLDLRGDEITEARQRLAAQPGASTVIIAGAVAAEQAARQLGVELQTLPV